MYRTSEEILTKLESGEMKVSAVSRNMNKYLHKKDINKWLLFAEAKALYIMGRKDE
tara:strand:- start:2457 stop:2624 length:168 start_codon:yes stop_codon:yes gene_type:complete